MTNEDIGKNFFVESITSHYYVGRLVEVRGPHTVVLENAAWIEHTGRLGRFMREGRTDNMALEVIGTRGVHWAGFSPWGHPLFDKDV